MSDAVANALLPLLVKQSGCKAARVERKISVRDNSVIYLAHLSAGQTNRAAIKCCLIPGTTRIDPAAARQQFNALTKVHGAFQGEQGHGQVPTPLFAIEDLAAYAMSWVDGDALTSHLRNWHDADLVIASHAQAGRWLANFHRSGPMRTAPADLANKIEHLTDMRRHPVRHRLFGEALNAVAEATSRIVDLPVSTSWLHGDCKPDNFMLAAKGLVGIDISLKYENAIENDLSAFLNGLELMLLDIRWHRAMRHAQRLQEAFLRGYISAGPSVSRALLSWLRLWSALTSWHAATVESNPRWPNRWLLNRQFNVLVGRRLTEMRGN